MPRRTFEGGVRSEQKELLPIVLTPREMEDCIYGGGRFPSEQRFYSMDQGGHFKFFFPEDLFAPSLRNAVYPVLFANDKLVGIAKLQPNPFAPNVFWIMSLSIDIDEQGKGYASYLAEELFQYAQKKGITLETSSYSKQGFIKLKPLFNALAEYYEVPFIDTDTTL